MYLRFFVCVLRLTSDWKVLSCEYNTWTIYTKIAVSYLIQNEDGGARQTTTIASYGFIPFRAYFRGEINSHAFLQCLPISSAAHIQ